MKFLNHFKLKNRKTRWSEIQSAQEISKTALKEFESFK